MKNRNINKKIIENYINEVNNFNKRQPKEIKGYDETIKAIIEELNFIMLQNHTIIQLLNTNYLEVSNEE